MKVDKFRVGDKVVYPSHQSIGTIIDITKETVRGDTISLYKIQLKKDNMVLHIPVDAASKSGLRILNSKNYISEHVIPTLLLPCAKKNEVWRNCSTEYESKLNSGDLTLIAEIIRDLFDNKNFTYSKRNLYEAALNRLVSEISSVYNITYEQAKKRLLMIKKGLARTIEESEGSSNEGLVEEGLEEAFN